MHHWFPNASIFTTGIYTVMSGKGAMAIYIV